MAKNEKEKKEFNKIVLDFEKDKKKKDKSKKKEKKLEKIRKKYWGKPLPEVKTDKGIIDKFKEFIKFVGAVIGDSSAKIEFGNDGFTYYADISITKKKNQVASGRLILDLGAMKFRGSDINGQKFEYQYDTGNATKNVKLLSKDLKRVFKK